MKINNQKIIKKIIKKLIIIIIIFMKLKIIRYH